MDRDKFIAEKSYIRYLGDASVLSGPLRNPGIGRIEEFRDFDGTERIYLYLPDRNEHIWCDHGRIESATIEEKHLIKCGFSVEEVRKSRRYRLGAVVISGALIYSSHLGQRIITGYCTADFTGGIQIDKYSKAEYFDFDKFYADFPPVNNLNELFDFLRSRGIQLNWDAIAII